MLKTLPYAALRTLEAVVRLRGFGRAAEELNVTQSSVSQQIKSLEEWLGHQLLHRNRRMTEPTEAGTRLAEAVRTGFGVVESLCDDLRGTSAIRKRGVRIAAPPGFAYLWLLPRLLQFDELHPKIPVSLSTDPESLDLRTSDADALISYSLGGFPDHHAEQLLTESLSPVCAPALARTIHSAQDLTAHVMLEDVHDRPEHPSTWEIWSRETNVPPPQFARKRRFGQANLVIQAAIDGLGIAMGRSPLVERALREGKLVQPLAAVAPSQFSYWLVCRHAALETPAVRAFAAWLGQASAAPDIWAPR